MSSVVAGLRMKHPKADGCLFDDAGREVALLHERFTKTELDRTWRNLDALAELGHLCLFAGRVLSITDPSGRVVMRLVGPHDLGTRAVWLLGPDQEELGVVTVACSP